MSAAEPIIPTPEQRRCASQLVMLMRQGVPHADALALIRLYAKDPSAERTRTVFGFVVAGIPFADAEVYADDPGFREALLVEIKRAAEQEARG